jgi:predicted DNA-binding ArsR family transcriptional regulator
MMTNVARNPKNGRFVKKVARKSVQKQTKKKVLNDTLLQYLHKGGYRFHLGQLRGLLMAKKLNGTVYVGWSLCKKGDKFTKNSAFYYANLQINTLADGYGNLNIPETIIRALKHTNFKDRCMRYFRTNVIVSTNFNDPNYDKIVNL